MSDTPGTENELTGVDAVIAAIQRPHRNLFKLYLLKSLAATIFFPFVFLPLLFRYMTLRYRFDAEGIGASWGVLFRREIYLNYRRIQDIHVTRNVIERWLGIGRVEIQTAAGSSSAELALEGMDRYEALRDFLYRRMRGTHDEPAAGTAATGTEGAAGVERVVALLDEIGGELEAARRALEGSAGADRV